RARMAESEQTAPRVRLGGVTGATPRRPGGGRAQGAHRRLGPPGVGARPDPLAEDARAPRADRTSEPDSPEDRAARAAAPAGAGDGSHHWLCELRSDVRPRLPARGAHHLYVGGASSIRRVTRSGPRLHICYGRRVLTMRGIGARF